MPQAIHQRAATRTARVLPFLLVLLVLACAKTTLTSVVNPPFRTVELRRVAVFFEVDDPVIRQSFEESFGERAGIASVDFIPSYTISSEPPIAGGRFARVASQNRVDALLTFTQREASITEPSTRRRALGTCDPVPFFSPCPPIVDGGWLEEIWASYNVALVDPANGVAFWTAKAMSEERDLATWEDLRNSLTDKTVDQLLKDGVISR